MTPETEKQILAELKRANDLKEWELRREPPRNVLQTIGKWWRDWDAKSARTNYG